MKTNYLYILGLTIALTAVPTYTMEQSLITTKETDTIIINYTQLPTNNLNIKEHQQIISPQTTTGITTRSSNYETTKNWIISSNKRETIVNYLEDSQQENEYLKKVLTAEDLNTVIIKNDHNQTCFKALKCIKKGAIPSIACVCVLTLLATCITFIAEDPCWYNKTMHCSPFK